MTTFFIACALAIIIFFIYKKIDKKIIVKKATEKLKLEYENSLEKLKSYINISKEAELLNIMEFTKINEIIKENDVSPDEIVVSEYGYNTFINKINTINSILETEGILNIIKNKIDLLTRVSNILKSLPKNLTVNEKYITEKTELGNLIDIDEKLKDLCHNYSAAIDDYLRDFDELVNIYQDKNFDLMRTWYDKAMNSFKVVAAFSDQIRKEINFQNEKKKLVREAHDTVLLKIKDLTFLSENKNISPETASNIAKVVEKANNRLSEFGDDANENFKLLKEITTGFEALKKQAESEIIQSYRKDLDYQATRHNEQEEQDFFSESYISPIEFEPDYIEPDYLDDDF